MHAAYCDDLADVVTSVAEMEAAPLRGGERPEGEVSETARGAEGLVGLMKDAIHASKGFASGVDELFS